MGGVAVILSNSDPVGAIIEPDPAAGWQAVPAGASHGRVRHATKMAASVCSEVGGYQPPARGGPPDLLLGLVGGLRVCRGSRGSGETPPDRSLRRLRTTGGGGDRNRCAERALASSEDPGRAGAREV